MSLLAYDLETCTHTLNKRRASPFHPENYVVAAGFGRDGGEPFGTYYETPTGFLQEGIPFVDEDTLLIGLNIKFDLLYSWHTPGLQDFFRRGGRIWDCQYVEYLLEGQQQHAQMCSMDSLVEKYGGTLKLDAVKQLWDEGVNTPDIDETLLMDYLLGNPEEGLEGDVNNTWLIFIGQVARAKKIHPHFLPMVARRMDGLLATTEMEYNGLKIDTVRGEADREALAAKLVELDKELQTFIPELPPELHFNWQSHFHKSYLIYGGAAKYEKWVQHRDPVTGEGLYANKTEKWPLFGGVPVDPRTAGVMRPNDHVPLYRRANGAEVQDIFKSGKRKGEGKTKNVTVPDLDKPKGAKAPHLFKFSGYTSPAGIPVSSLKDGEGEPIYSTSADTIEKLAARNIPFLKLLGERQAASKLLGTYYWADDAKSGDRKGMLTLVGEDGYIHHKLNHTATVTTRLSSSDPNMQNVPRADKSDVKAMFVSRFGSDGVMAEIDYSQLEVVIQGMLSRDTALVRDINNGVDFHCMRLAKKLNEPYSEVVAKAKDENHPEYTVYSEMRQGCKEFSFQRAYGAGAAAIAGSTGMSAEEVEALINAEEQLYPGVAVLDRCVEDSINASRQVTKRELFVAGKRFNACSGEWFSPSGIRYVWTEGEAPAFLHSKGKYVGFSPTERKNWPIQGEGGFVVQAMLGYLFRKFNKENNWDGRALLVNTVHDCVWLDMHKSVVDEVIPAASAIMEAVPSMYKRNFKIDVPVPFPVEAEVGPNMLELEHYHA